METSNKDIPRVDGGTVFVIYSKLQRDGDAHIIPSLPDVQATPQILTQTGIASAVGGYSGSKLSIQPVVSNGSLTWDVLCYEQNSEAASSFSIEITTNGNSEAGIEAVTVTFTFHVILLGRTAIITSRLFTFYVGDSVKAALTLPAINPIISYSFPDGDPVDPEGNTCGISIKRYLNQQNQTYEYFLSGVADRPGVFGFTLRAEYWGEGGQWAGDISNPFLPSESRIACLISVIEANFTEGTLIAVSQASFQPKHDFFRLNMHRSSHSWMEGAIGEYTQSGTVWSRTTPFNDATGSIDLQYRVEKDGGDWVYSCYNNSSHDWDELERITQTVRNGLPPGANQKIPPNNGWQLFSFSGSGDYRVTRNGESLGFFDFKGELQYQDQEGNSFTKPYYEQAALHVTQYAHVQNQPPAVRFNDAMYLYWKQSLEKYVLRLPNGTEYTDFKMKKAKKTALPYAPPVSEKIGDHVIRDIQAASLSLHRLPGNLCFNAARMVGGYWPYYPAARSFVPYNGTETSQYSAQASFRTWTKNNSSSLFRQSMGDHIDSWIFQTASKLKDEWSVAMSATIPSGGFRSGDIPTMFLFVGESPEIEVNYSYENKSFEESIQGGSRPSYWSETIADTIELGPILACNNLVGIALFNLISAPKDGINKNAVFCNASASMGGSKTFETVLRHSVKYVDFGLPDEESISYGTKNIGSGISASSPIPILVSSDLRSTSSRGESGSKSFFCKQNCHYEKAGVDTIFMGKSGIIDLSWSSTPIEGHPGMFTGTTVAYIKETMGKQVGEIVYDVYENVIVDGTFNDPQRAIFEQYAKQYGQGFSWYEDEPEGMWSMKNETRTESEILTGYEITL